MKARNTWIAVALAALTSTATAAEIWNHPFPVNGQLQWNGFIDGSTSVNVSKTNAPSVSYNGSGGQYGGSFYTDGTESPDEFFRFFCIDLFQTAATGPFSYAGSLFSNTALARLYDVAYPNKAVGDFYNSGQTSFGDFTSNILSSAFQLAVWEIIYETNGTYGLTGSGSGSFKSNAGANAAGSNAEKAVYQANAWLAQINSGAGSAAGWTLYKFENGNRQDFVAATYVPGGTVPEPGVLSLLAFGFGAIASARRRREGSMR